jgi:hypothetical protein
MTTPIDVKLQLQTTLAAQVKAEENAVRQSLTGMSSAANGMGAAFTKMAGVVGVSLTAMYAVSKMKQMAQDSLNLGDQITDMSRRMGLTTDAFQKLSYMAKMSGADLGGMTRAIVSIANEATKSNTIFGVSTREMGGNVKSTGVLFQDLVMKISDIKNPTDRLAVSMKLFGRAGFEVNAMASQGRERLQELAGETETYGLILDTKTIKALHEAKEAQERLNKVWEIAAAKLTGALAPAIEWYARVLTGENLVTAAKEIQIERTIALAKEEDNVGRVYDAQHAALIKLTKLRNELNSPNRGFGARSTDVIKKDIADTQMEADKYGLAISAMHAARIQGKTPKEINDLLEKGGKKGTPKYEAYRQSMWAPESESESAREEEAKAKSGWREFGLLPESDEKENERALKESFDRRAKLADELQMQYASPREKEEMDYAANIKVVGGLGPDVIATKQKNALLEKMAKDHSDKLKKLDDDDKKRKSQAFVQEAQLYGHMAQQVIRIADNIAQVQLNHVEAQKQAETDAVEHSHMSAKAKQKKLDQINKEAAAKEREINKEKQTWSIAQAVIGGALAIVQGYAQSGPIVGSILAVLTAAVTASEIAVIASQKFAQGGVVQGTGGTDSVTAKVTPNEVVMTPEQQANTLMAIARGNGSTTTNNNAQHHYDMSITIQGNASQATVQEIRQTQMQQVRELKRTMQAAQRLRQVA